MAKECIHCGRPMGFTDILNNDRVCKDCWNEGRRFIDEPKPEAVEEPQQSNRSPSAYDESNRFSPDSGWALFFYVCAGLNFLLCSFIAIVTSLIDFFIYGVVAAVSCLFFAFICQAIVDIRYILYQTLLATKEKSPMDKSE